MGTLHQNPQTRDEYLSNAREHAARKQALTDYVAAKRAEWGVTEIEAYGRLSGDGNYCDPTGRSWRADPKYLELRAAVRAAERFACGDQPAFYTSLGATTPTLEPEPAANPAAAPAARFAAAQDAFAARHGITDPLAAYERFVASPEGKQLKRAYNATLGR